MRKIISATLLLLMLTAGTSVSAQPRNVILFLGDGMGISTVTAARIHAGQLAGGKGEDHVLAFETFPNVALVKTFAVDRQVPDSASTTSAIMTGHHGRFLVLNVDPSVEADDCPGALAKPLTTLLERAEQAGFQTGIVSTARLTHATPAATYAHSASRSWEHDALVPDQAKKQGCVDIARQFVEFSHGDGIEVTLAGGRQEFLAANTPDPEYPGQFGLRQDGRNLVNEWLESGKGRKYVWDMDQFAGLEAGTGGQVLGLFEPSHMQYEIDRRSTGENELDIVQLTEFAIKHLANDDQGFFLMIEGGRIDHAHHDSNAARALMETVMMDRAVARALELTGPDNTMIMVTADHSHVFTISGYPERGNPILGTYTPFGDDMEPGLKERPYTTLAYANGPGYLPELPDLSQVDTTDPDYRQYAGWPLASETHGGEDVAAYATGPGAERLRGVIEQRRLYDVLAAALFEE